MADADRGRGRAPLGFQERVLPRPDDVFALGFLARGAVVHGDREIQELPIAAVETVSTAFLGLTVGCAKCHDHMYDPISQRDFYSMKALFDPLALKKLTLANPAEVAAHGKTLDVLDRKMAAVEKPILELIAPYKKKLLDERIAQLPADVRAVILKPQKQRTPEEEKIADDYFPILRIDVSKIMAIMPEAERERYRDLVKELQAVAGRQVGRGPAGVLDRGGRSQERDGKELHPDQRRPRPAGKEPRSRPRLAVRPAEDRRSQRPDRGVCRMAHRPRESALRPGGRESALAMALRRGPAKDAQRLRRAGRHARRIRRCSIGWRPSSCRRDFSMKAMHRLIVTSQTYKHRPPWTTTRVQANGTRSTRPTAICGVIRLRRLDAETVWDSIFATAGNLDLTIGGPSFDPGTHRAGQGAGATKAANATVAAST